MTAYYNEINKHAAEWLRKLIANGQIAPGDVDERSIEDVRADDLVGYTQCHFFAGIGGWSLALRLANWPDDREVWTGSCPCQPYSVAGRGLADADPRNLWPQFRRLIAERRPPGVFGEQVAGKAGRSWFAGVRGDLEALGDAAGGADLCAAGVSAPHIRQRLYWVAHLDQTGWRDLAQGATGSEPMAWVAGLVTGTVKENRPGLKMDRPVGLNPAWACWLMGFPDEWTKLAPTVTPSSRKSRKPSLSA